MKRDLVATAESNIKQGLDHKIDKVKDAIENWEKKVVDMDLEKPYSI